MMAAAALLTILAPFLFVVCSVASDSKLAKHRSMLDILGDKESHTGGDTPGRQRREATHNDIAQFSEEWIAPSKPVIHLGPQKMGLGGSLKNFDLDFRWISHSGFQPVNMSMVHNDQYIQVPATGVYFVYSQLYYKMPYTSYGHCITSGHLDNSDNPDVEEIICSSQSKASKARAKKTVYIGSPLFLHEKDIIGVRMRKILGNNARRQNTVLLNPKTTFFGAFMI